MHTGSLVAAVGSYLMAKRSGGLWLLRLDDLDTQRQVPGAADDIMRTLESLGLLWDGEVARQSRHLEDYRQAFDALQQKGMIYPCSCSRSEIARSSSAPHPGDDCLPYAGTCRSGMKAGSAVRSWRVRVTEQEICFHDLRAGRVCQALSVIPGDFAVRRGDGEFAYQLAVVVDDHLAGVDQVVRGEDLLASTPRQIYLQRLLGYPQPDYCHLPLVTGPGGGKLSKRDHLVSFRESGPDGTGGEALLEALRFLGQDPPADLAGSPCEVILAWGIRSFSLLNLQSKSRTMDGSAGSA